MNIYDLRRFGTALFLAGSIAVVVAFVWVSNNLVADLAVQERERMQIWADATKQLADISQATDVSGSTSENIDFLFGIIEQNHTIPVLLTDNEGNILLHRNFDLPEEIDSLTPWVISPRNDAYLHEKLHSLEKRNNVIHIIISPDNFQHLYYDDSKTLKRLSYYPYVQLLVMLTFIAIVYFAVNSTRRAEQNKVWVGLSKETAHQLGTPISSLMAWTELLRSMGIDEEMVKEMDKDVNRLSMIASRFSKIGSRPNMEPADLNEVVDRAASYMATRISSRIKLTIELCSTPLEVDMSAPLFEWVMENLIKNAVDAMEGSGSITVRTFQTVSRRHRRMACVTVADTGKGIPRKNHKTVFNPGFTTKKRGWGLGLALAKRIIDQYHHGRIYVASSTELTAGSATHGTTFRIDLPLLS